MREKIHPAESATTVVFGIDVDFQYRCDHSLSLTDVVAVRAKCCNKYYACVDCHNAHEDHSVAKWQEQEFNTHAVLCGLCRVELTISEVMLGGNRCPLCSTRFDPSWPNNFLSIETVPGE